MSKNALKKVMDHAQAGLEARKAFFDSQSETLVEIARVMAKSLTKGGKVKIGRKNDKTTFSYL